MIANRKFLTKHRSSKKYNELFSVILVKFREDRRKGHLANFNWLRSKARVIYWSQLNIEKIVVKKCHRNINALTFECVADNEIKSNQRSPLEKIYENGIG